MVAPHGHSSSRHVFPMNPANRSKITSSLFEEEEGKQSAATTLPKSLSVSPQRKLKPRIKPLLRWLRLVLFAASIGRLAAVGGTNIEIRSLRDSDFMNQTSGLAMESVGDGGVFVPIVPLTEGGGLGRDDEFLKTINLSGKLDLYNSDKRGVSLKAPNSIAYLNCESNSGRNSTSLFQSIVQLEFSAVVLYTTTDDHYCILTGSTSPLNVFTSISPSSSRKAFNSLDTTLIIPPVLISYHDTYNSTDISTSGQSNTAAVALFVLYAFTGVLGSFFICVLAIGTYRAHRNPERYGPRNEAMHGRPRQSRAKGLARAVLDTIPIVHFNIAGNVQQNHYPVLDRKPGDLEMARPVSQRALTSSSSRTSEVTQQRPLTIHETDAITETPSPLRTPPTGTVNHSQPEFPGIGPGQVQCPVCQENFEKGQQLRVLPCRHSFHQACIDPWLLDRSGSCPLCRIDLRPEDARQSFQMPPPPPPGVLPSNSRGRSAVPELGITRLATYIKKRRAEARSRNGSVAEGAETPPTEGTVEGGVQGVGEPEVPEEVASVRR